MTEYEIEAVARAFYAVNEAARGWDREPEALKARFLSDARAAIAALDGYRADKHDTDGFDPVIDDGYFSPEKD